jgi:hypothetical protein
MMTDVSFETEIKMEPGFEMMKVWQQTGAISNAFAKK